MARKQSKLYHIYYRNEAVWIWWSNGKGGKTRKRVYDEEGNGITKTSPEIEQEKWASKTYHRWSDDSASTSCRAEKEKGGLRLGELTAFYVESQGSWWDLDTVDAYILFLDLLHDFFGLQSRIDGITHRQALEFMEKLRKERIGSGATDRKYLGFYRNLFRYAVDTGALAINPFQTIRSAYKKKDKPRKNAFSPDEVSAILAASKRVAHWFTPALVIAAVTGVRQSELIQLRVYDAHVHTTMPYLKVRDEIAKGGIGRNFGLSPSIANLLCHHVKGRDRNEYLFQSKSGHRIPINHFNISSEGGRIKRTWLKIQQAAGVTPRRFNCLRQSVDTNLTSRAGIQSAEAAKFVGHTQAVSETYYQDRPLDVSSKLVDTMCELYNINFDAGRGEDEANTRKTQDIYPRSEILDLVG